MPSAGSCVRCSRPLEVESVSGLCPECLRTAGQGGDTHRDRPPPPDQPTPLAPEPDDRTRTLVRQPDATTATVVPAALTVPMPLAPAGYELIRELGAGGMGVVYLARDHTTEQLVAMKFLQRSGSQSAFDRFLVELRALAALNHPHIIRVLGHDFLRADPYFVTEYAPGGSLSAKLEESGSLDPAEAARLVAAAARAVHAAHAAHVVHRDLKPSNILLAADGSPRVSDFGLAKRTDRDDQLTASGPLGTPAYMAPEQAGPRDRPVGARADVYGLGATLYHLVTGRPPFSGPHDEVIRRVPKEPPTPPRDVRRAVPIELEAVILKCLEKDPDRRYQSAEELAADLDRYLAGSVPAAPLLTWRRRVALAVRRNRLGLTVAGAVVLLLIAAAAAWIATRPVDPREQIRKELLAGRPVTLIGESGPPKWHAWAYGPTALGESATGDKTCAFESIGDALLVLLDDPGIDRYAVTADLRILRSKTPADPKKAPDHNEAPGSNRVGLFVSHAIAVASNGQPVPTFLVVSYNDYLSPAIRKLGLTQATAQFELGFVGIRQGAQGALAQPMHDESTTFGINRPIRFTSAEILPGEWRRIRIEVTPDGVRSFWAADPQDPFIPLATVSVAEIARRAAPACTEFVSAHPGAALPLPPWSPRMPLGIWSRGANVAVRNVIVEPLPSPRP